MEPLHKRGIRLPKIRRILRTRHFGIEERTFQMNAKASRATAVPRSPLPVPRSPLVAFGGGTQFGKVFFGARKAGREETCHAVRELAATDDVKRRIRRIAEVRSAASVGMDVDKARQQRKPVRLDDLVPQNRTDIRSNRDDLSTRDTHTRDAKVTPRRYNARANNCHCPTHFEFHAFRVFVV